MIRTYNRKRGEPIQAPNRKPLSEIRGSTSNRRVDNAYSHKVKSVSKIAKKSFAKSACSKSPIQLVFGTQSQHTCTQCLMSYIPTSISDVSLHTRFHQRSLEGREWTEDGRQNKVFSKSFTEYIVRVDASSCLAHKRGVEDLMSLANTELSAPRENPSWKTVTGKGAAFVYIKSRRAVAIVVVERACRGRYMDVTTGQLVSNRTIPVIMGVSRIYCVSNHRRSGFATSLLDISCKEFIYGLNVAKKQVAWSQPSASGARLAESWNGVSDKNTASRYILTYLESECV